jgi:hypothetical protein
MVGRPTSGGVVAIILRGSVPADSATNSLPDEVRNFPTFDVFLENSRCWTSAPLFPPLLSVPPTKPTPEQAAVE